VRNSVIMANTFIGRSSVVDNCILDEEITTGDSCRIGGSNNIIVLGKRRIVQSNCCVPYVPSASRTICPIGDGPGVATLAMAY
jgi:NDP-sugar pyrophosphorylase family protein